MKIEIYKIRIEVVGLPGDALVMTYVGTYDEMAMLRKALMKGSRVEVTVDKPVPVA